MTMTALLTLLEIENTAEPKVFYIELIILAERIIIELIILIEIKNDKKKNIRKAGNKL